MARTAVYRQQDHLGPAQAGGFSGASGWRRLARLVAAGLALAGLAATTAAAAAAGDGRWGGLERCELSMAGGRLSAQARCGRFEVPENRAEPNGRQIELAYAVLPARARRARPDPVFFLAGGPGQSARDVLPVMRLALREINRERDIVFLDQRGTGGSNKLDCRFETLEDWLELDLESIERQLRECRRGWDADLRHYTTADAAADLEALRQHHGLAQINLLGGSYGSRLAQVYLRAHPERVRSVILDGVVPTRLRLGSEHGLMLDRTLARLIDSCGEEPHCAERFPALDTAFQSLVQHYGSREHELLVTNPRTGRAEPLRFSRDTLASALRFLAYSPQSQMMLPYLIHEAAATGDPSRIASQALIVHEQMDDMIAIGLNFAVGCSEDWPSWPRQLDQSHTLLGNSMLEFYDRICAWWPAGEVADDFFEPFDAEAPILLLSGEFDPVTPPSYGEEAAGQFSNSRHLVGAGLGHIVITHPCFGDIAARFVAAADVAELPTECLDRLGPEPFFLDLLGPAP